MAIRERSGRVTSGPLVGWFVANDRKHSRLGISIGRVVGNAVKRNAIKRYVREAFRQHPPEAPLDVVVQIRPHELATAERYSAWWQQLLQRQRS